MQASEFLAVEGKDLLSSWDSSPGFHRYFASCCGSPIYKLNDAKPDVIGLRMGTLDTDPGRLAEVHFMSGSKCPWVEIKDDLRQDPDGPPFGQRD